MYQSTISWNINGKNTPHYPELEAHLTRLNPRWLLIMDNIQMCRYFADKFPFSNIIARNWALTQGDENVYTLTPTQWLDARLPEAAPNIWLSTANEGGLNVKWDIELMQLVLSRGLKNVRLVIGNLSVGTPALPDWTTADKKLWFQLLDQNRNQFALGLHEYFCGIAPSGFVGGYPDGTWSDGRKDLHPNYEDRKNWPDNPFGIGQLWHCGRLMSINTAARSFGYAPPRIVITEHGIDRLGDMLGWMGKFQPSAPFNSLRGWKSWKNGLAKLLPNMSHEQAYFESVGYLDSHLYAGFSNVEAQLIYTWSSSPDWNDFDMSETAIFQALLERYVDSKVPTVPIPPPAPTSVSVPIATLKMIRDSIDGLIPK